MVKKKSWEQPDLSLSEDDEGARFAGAGLGFRARGFGAGFSVNQKDTSTDFEKLCTNSRAKNGF